MGEELEGFIVNYREKIVSFSSGVSITYIFMQLIPEFHNIALESTQLIFVFPLAGFSSVHLLEKYIDKSGIPKEKMRKDYVEIHSIFLFLYYGSIGYLIASLLAENAASGLLFFLPIILHAAVSSFSVTEIHESFKGRNYAKYSISLAPILGVLIHNFGNIADQYFNFVFGTVIGMFFYIVVRDSIPRDEKGKPKEYMIGVMIYLAIILITNIL